MAKKGEKRRKERQGTQEIGKKERKIDGEEREGGRDGGERERGIGGREGEGGGREGRRERERERTRNCPDQAKEGYGLLSDEGKQISLLS